MAVPQILPILSSLLGAWGALLRECRRSQEFLPLLHLGFDLYKTSTIKWPYAVFWHAGMSDKYCLPREGGWKTCPPSKGGWDHLASGVCLPWLYLFCRTKFIAWCLRHPIADGAKNFCPWLMSFDLRDASHYKTALCHILTYGVSDKYIVTYAGKINQNYENFLLYELNAEVFKCLIFLQRLNSNRDKDIWIQIHIKTFELEYWLN